MRKYNTYIDFYYRGLCPICRNKIRYFYSRAENKTRLRNAWEDKVVCLSIRQIYLLLFGREESRIHIWIKHLFNS